MEIEIIDGFKFERVGTRILNLLIESDRLEESIIYIKNKNISRISINRQHGYYSKNIDFVADVKELIKEIDIVQDDIDITNVNRLNNLIKLYIGGENYCTIDFANFPNLKSCNITWSRKIVNLSACGRLEDICLRKFVLDTKTENILSKFVHAKRLIFMQSKIYSLKFLQDLKCVNILEFHYVKSEIDIFEIGAISQTLERLVFDHCPKLKNEYNIGQLSRLKMLNITSSSELNSISFVTSLLYLKHFSFVNTAVKDGDMSPCIGIDFVSFSDSSKYSHTNAEIDSINSAKST